MIREMSKDECLRVLAGTKFARLACAREDQPYIVPVFLAYYEPLAGEACFYGFTIPGQKLEWMRANPLVCVEVDKVEAYDQWVSVIGFGRFEELPEIPGSDDARRRAQERPRRVAETSPVTSPEILGAYDERSRAFQLLKAQVMWWEPGSSTWAARVHRDPGESYIPVYYKIWIDRVTGHESTWDARSLAVTASAAGKPGWLRGALRCVFGSSSG
jgi:uncharacterized protein